MGVKEVGSDWNEFGKRDAMWAILSDPEKRGKRWREQDFFETGVKETSELMAYIESLGVSLARHKALDFGCGIGRLSQALAAQFEEVHGVDAAASMIELANQYNRRPQKCVYHLNMTPALPLFEDNKFDLIYSNIVLQHIEPECSKNYMREFVRVLAPRGLIVFQLPSLPSRAMDVMKYRFKLAIKTGALALLRRMGYFSRPPMLMYGMKREEVEKLFTGWGARIVDVKSDQSAGKGWESFRYCVTKP
ncbi:MAG TPA: class I SAM-dependent methyltransferase [Terriglobia bacterium]|nr:class I SAM-dependent methyltransferase [Terriglobia bacterium]